MSLVIPKCCDPLLISFVQNCSKASPVSFTFGLSTDIHSLRRENLIRWTLYLEDCTRVLEAANIHSDWIICRWVHLQHLADDVAVQFSIEDPSSCVGLDNASVRFALQGFESQLRNSSKELWSLSQPGSTF